MYYTQCVVKPSLWTPASMATTKKFLAESYKTQVECHWPARGRHILAQFDDDTVVVYQAFCPEIAEYAVSNKKLGGSKYSFTRMSWIKTNFLWMMYRCGWATKPGQERVLALWIPRWAFEAILSQAYTAEAQTAEGKVDISVRLQWDPDHTPEGGKLERKAIQLGLRGEMLKSFATEWIVDIEDITPFVKQQRAFLKNEMAAAEQLLVARERIYTVVDQASARLIGVDSV